MHLLSLFIFFQWNQTVDGDLYKGVGWNTRALIYQLYILQILSVYSQLPLRWTRSGQAPIVRFREVSALEGDEVNDRDKLPVSTLERCPL